jgi:hypothetical protein
MSTAPTLCPGSRATLTGLQSKPLLNNHLVDIVKYLQDQDRFQCRPVGQAAKEAAAPTFLLAIKAYNLRLAPSSAFLVKVEVAGKRATVPLECSVALDGFGRPGIRLMFSDFLGLDVLIPALLTMQVLDDEDVLDEEIVRGAIAQVEYDIVTSPCYDEAARAKMGAKECVIVRTKHTKEYEAMIDFGLIQDTGKRAQLGFWKDVHVCKINFPFTA